MMQKDIYYKLKNGKLGVKPADDSEAEQLIKIFKDYNLIYKGDVNEPSIEYNTTKLIYIDNDEWCYDYTDENQIVSEVITYQEFISKYITEDINSDKKDLIKKLIDEYLEENEVSINEEIFLKRFGDFCKERLDG